MREVIAVQTQDKTNPSTTLKTVFEWMSSLIAALVAVAVAFCFLFRIVTVDGESMMNTLQHGDNLIMISRFYELERGDVIVINYRDDEPLIKRVIGMEGDVIDIDDFGQVYVNGDALEEPYIRDGITSTMGAKMPYVVPQGTLFAMGDNRLESKDSRMLGAFSTSDVLGEVVYRISPFDRVGRFD